MGAARNTYVRWILWKIRKYASAACLYENRYKNVEKRKNYVVLGIMTVTPQNSDTRYGIYIVLYHNECINF